MAKKLYFERGMKIGRLAMTMFEKKMKLIIVPVLTVRFRMSIDATSTIPARQKGRSKASHELEQK